MLLRNNTDKPVNGMAPGAEAECDPNNAIIQAWVRQRILIPPASQLTTTQAAKEVAAAQDSEKDDLIRRLSLHGITKDRRSSLETLRSLLAEAQSELMDIEEQSEEPFDDGRPDHSEPE